MIKEDITRERDILYIFRDGVRIAQTWVDVNESTEDFIRREYSGQCESDTAYEVFRHRVVGHVWLYGCDLIGG